MASSCPGTGLHRDGGHVRLRPVARRAGRDGEEDHRPDRAGGTPIVEGPGGLCRPRTSTRPDSAWRGSWPGCTRPRRGSSCWSPAWQAREGRHGRRRRLPGSRASPATRRKPYDGFQNVAGHALCNAHLLRELTAVTETGTADDVIWARQAIDALLELKDRGRRPRRRAGRDRRGSPGKHSRWFRDAAAAGITPNATQRASCKETARPGHPDARPRG